MDRYLGYWLTPWYAPDVRPVRVGLYVVGSDKLSVMNYWDGRQWLRGDNTPAEHQDVCWRGVLL